MPDLEHKMTQVFQDISQENSKFFKFLNQPHGSILSPEEAKDIREALHDLELALEKQDKSIDVLLDLFSEKLDLAGSSSTDPSEKGPMGASVLSKRRDALFKWMSTGIS